MSQVEQPATRTPLERGVELLDMIDYRLMETEEEKDEIYRLRYRAYLQEGAIEPNPQEIITDRFDDMPNSYIFGVYVEGVLASSIRLSISSPDHPMCPSVAVFGDLLQADVDQGKVIVDPTRFVADPLRQKRFPELPYMTLRLCFVACNYFNADLGLATVRVEHQSFYKRLFMHQPISGPRMYPGLTKAICLMAVDYPASREKVYARYPYLRSSFFERRMLFERRHPGAAGAADMREAQFERASIAPRA